MKIVFTAIWYDPDKVRRNAIAAGWNPDSGDGHLDIYSPDEDPNGHEERDFTDLDEAITFLRRIVADGKDFWGQARINKYEVDGKRCKYCTCRGWNCVHTYIVDDDGVAEDHAEADCFSDD